MQPKALCLLSGGLDSTLAARIVLDLGVELEAVNFVTAFCTCTPKTAGCAAAVSASRQLGIRVRTFNVTDEFLGVVSDPPHGYGTYLNPCIDCRILMFGRALSHMKQIGARFLVTGEVLGERPMSQHRDAMRLIERESGAEGLCLRPLSAGLLEPSLPEREGWVDRTKLLSIGGRSRKPQIALARELGVNDYPCPAGGCRLTDPGFAGRMKDLLDHDREITPRDVRLLRWGRHFRLSPLSKAVVGRNEGENERVSDCAGPEDILIEPTAIPGPTTLLVGDQAGTEQEVACAVAAAYTAPAGRASKACGPAPDLSTVELEMRGADGVRRSISVRPMPRERAESLRLCPLARGWRRSGRAGRPSLDFSPRRS